MKKFKKKCCIIIILILFIFPFLSLTGCNKNENLNVDDFVLMSLNYNQEDVSWHLYFSVNSKTLLADCSELEINNFIKNLEKNVDNLRTEYVFNLAIKYIQNPKEEYSINRGVLITPVQYIKEYDVVGFSVKYLDYSTFNYYHSSSSSSSLNNQGNFFIYKKTSKGINPFSNMVQVSENQKLMLGERYKNLYLDSINLSSLNIDSSQYTPTFIYDYGCTQSYIKTDSDVKLQQGGLFHHYWLESEESLKEGQNVTLSIQFLKSGPIQLVIVIFVLFSMGLTIFVVFLKERKTKRKI